MRISVRNGLPLHIRICIDAAVQPDRIALNISPDCWVIVPVPILRQPRLTIEDLSRRAQIVGQDSLEQSLTRRLRKVRVKHNRYKSDSKRDYEGDRCCDRPQFVNVAKLKPCKELECRCDNKCGQQRCGDRVPKQPPGHNRCHYSQDHNNSPGSHHTTSSHDSVDIVFAKHRKQIVRMCSRRRNRCPPTFRMPTGRYRYSGCIAPTYTRESGYRIAI